MSADRQIVVWTPPQTRGEGLKEAQRQAALANARQAEARARQALAERKERLVAIRVVGEELALAELRKKLRMSNDPEFANTPVLEGKDIIKMLEIVQKEWRLDSGQATEQIAHTLGPSVDFSRMTQAERDEWRRLAVKGGAEDG